MTAGRATNGTAIVVGAGIGGMAAGIQLRKLGYRVSILEQAPSLGEIGAGIQLAPNATRVLEDLGIIKHLKPFAVVPESVVWRRWFDGKCLAEDKLGEETRAEFGTPYWHVHRADLHRALVAAAEDEGTSSDRIQVVLDQHVTHLVSEGEDRVTVGTSDGHEYTADFLIGADGIHSEVRGWLGPDEEKVHSGDSAFRALVAAEKVKASRRLAELLDRPMTTLWVGPGRHVVHYEVRDRSLINIVAFVNTKDLAAESWLVSAEAAEMVEAFDGWDERLLELFSLAESVRYSGVYDRRPLDRWVRRRIALLGDACHAMLPYRAQGAAQALEDVAALGRLLQDAEADDVPDRLREYEAVRKPVASAVQASSREAQASLHLNDGDDQRERDERLGVSPQDDAYERYRWIWTPDKGNVT